MLEVLRNIVQEVAGAPNLEAVLNLIVQRTHRAMQTEVCSVYLFEPDQQKYVLMATQGLNKAAVGQVSLSPTEGIVGLVGSRAEPINLEDASTHPAFIYQQVLGEDKFHAFLGVPIIHHRNVLGVLVVQQRNARCFDQEEEAFLITMSAQLAGVIAHAAATGAIHPCNDGGKDEAPCDHRFDGVAGCAGVAVGHVVVISPCADLASVPDKQIEPQDSKDELRRFRKALASVRRDIRLVGRSLAKHLSGEELALFEVYMRMLEDNALAGEIMNRIRAGQWAQGALRQVIDEHISQFSHMDDPYLRERATDIRDLGRRVLGYLQKSAPPRLDFPEDAILVADELSPALLGEVPTDKLAGLVSVHGSGNSHAAILARSMGIPTVMGVLDLPYTRLDGQPMILDGYSGCVLINPSDELSAAFRDVQREDQAVARELESLRDEPAQTLDGLRMPLWVNTGLVADVARSLEHGAEGIGLYRTEIPFMIKDIFPSEAEQEKIYRKQLEAFAPRSVTMRTLDIGGDKSLTYFPIEEDNPFLGWRGIRVTLDHPDIFLVQVRAMLRASIGLNNLRIMLPMVSSVNEVDEANRLIDRAVVELAEEGCLISRPPVGVMIEVPAAVYQIRRFARRVEFISVGSNDLTQYLLAVDRNNPRVAGLYMPFHPAVLHALEHIANEAHAESLAVSICGELAADPAGAILLMAMGYDVLSMNATHLPRVKSAIRGVSVSQAQTLLEHVKSMDDAEEIHAFLRSSLRLIGLGQLARPEIPHA